MSNWRTNIGGAIGAMASGLTGVGVLGQFASTEHKELLFWMAVLGFVSSAVGKCLTALFAADARELKRVSDAVKDTGDTTTFIRKALEVKRDIEAKAKRKT